MEHYIAAHNAIYSSGDFEKLFASSNTTFVMETEKDSYNKEDRFW